MVLIAQQLVVVCALMLLGGPQPAAQTRPSTPLGAAEQALKSGRYDEVASILANERSLQAVALIARSEIARGRYADAQKRLTPVATSQPTSDAALELGLLHLYLGRRAEAGRTLNTLMNRLDASSADDYLRLARATQALADLATSRTATELYQTANGYYRSADKLAPNNAAINTAWGELFLQKYELGEAQKSFELALKADPNDPAALIGAARVALESNPPAAETAVQRALKANPSYVPAHVLAAEIALNDQQRDEAKKAILAALDVNPNSLEAISLDAATAFLEDKPDEFTRRAQKALDINPGYGEVYRVAGDHAARNYRFDEAVTLTRRALAIDGQNVRAHADLGVHLLRTGDEAAARTALETAFKGDQFYSNLSTKNMLEMLDRLDKFETVTSGDIILRFAPEEAAVMREQAVSFARNALDTLAKKWDFKPTGPILIEMFPVHDDFAVRTIGLPGFLGALGACFGRVVTLDSPHARPPGQYNWQPTLWHELAHVITIQMSNQRVPRWLTEGISVWEEKRGRPEWGREMEVTFAHALDEGKILKLKVLNEGFSDPRMISLAYYEASLVVQHLVDTYGEPSLRAFLRAYGRGRDTEAAIKEVYGVTIDELQTSFDARLEKDYAALRAALKRPQIKGEQSLDDWKRLAMENPGSFPVQMALGAALQEAKDYPAAIQAFERAAKLIPLATGDDNPNTHIAEIALAQKDTTRAIAALDAVVKVDHTDVESARKLASLLAPLGDAARTEDAYRRVVDVDPFDSQAQTSLGRLALQRRDIQRAVPAFRTALATNPPDRAAAHLDLAEAYLAAGQSDDAKKQILAALEIAPSFERAQDLLLKIVDGAPK